LRNASLKNADLRGATLREAVLCGADLSGARLDGADFQDANLAGAKLTGVDIAKAKNLVVPSKHMVGPKLKELAAAAKGSKNFESKAVVDLGDQGYATLEVGVTRYGNRSRAKCIRPGHSEVWDSFESKSLEQSIHNVLDRWHIGKLRLDSITASGSKSVRGAKLQELAVAAWAECCGVNAASAED
jgi:hypothetical protein